ncbi:MAG: OsmC family protein [Fimbriimonadaceae bacterium]|nr:OsmC family protein [Alphaproteobacteria bacterium]
MELEDNQRITTIMQGEQITVRDRQAPVRKLYESDPKRAWTVDSARTSSEHIHADHPIHGHVIFGTGVPASQPISVHRAVGGESDFPCPGETLAAAIAACLDTATRMVANLLDIRLERLQVTVDLGVDVRGTLMMGSNVPVGFQKVDISYELKAADDVTDAQLATLMKVAERSCVILETLRNPPDINVVRNQYSG